MTNVMMKIKRVSERPVTTSQAKLYCVKGDRFGL